jgi:hypothetical protein
MIFSDLGCGAQESNLVSLAYETKMVIYPFHSPATIGLHACHRLIAKAKQVAQWIYGSRAGAFS